MPASASLVLGWRLDRLCEVRKVEGRKKFDQDTGKPVPNPVDALFVLGKQVANPDEDHPCEWDDILGMSIHSVGDGSDNRHGEGLRSYDLEKFVAGNQVASTDRDADCNGALTEVVVSHDAGDKAKVLLADLCRKLGVDASQLTGMEPTLYLVCYNSY